jgi:gamma-glutamyltranspeptidase/glutathione hydrolase
MNLASAASSARYPVFADNIVATSHPLAAQAGLRMFELGGNAVDAALASAISLVVLEPVSTGLGSDSFAMLWDGEKVHGLNGSGGAPRAWSADVLDRWKAIPGAGWNSVTVPGAVASWNDLSQRFGALPFARLFEPAISWAESGFPVSPGVAERWVVQVGRLKDQPGFAETFLPSGRAPLAGERFRNPALARSLKAIAETRGESFYRGALADAMIAHSRANDGMMSHEDLSAHRSEWVEPLDHDCFGCTWHQMPPNANGIVLLMALGILAETGFAGDCASPEHEHLQLEAYKLAAAETERLTADGTAPSAALALLDPDYLRSRARMIGTQAQNFEPGLRQQGGTVFVTAGDRAGRLVSFIQSNYVGFGSGVVVPGTGISLHNRAAGFTLQKGHPNYPAPGKRPAHTILPALISRNGAPLMSLGVTGGNMQPQGQLQIALRIILDGHNPQSAIDAPRFRHMAGLDINLEDAMPEKTRQFLAERGHRVLPLPEGYMDFGSAQALCRHGDCWVAGTDGRKDGAAVGI